MKKDFITDSPFVCVVIINWNDMSNTEACLKSLHNIDYPNFHIIVVDNGSKDGSPEKINHLFPEIALIRNTKNVGFAEGNNVAINKAIEMNADYIFVLNNDTVVHSNILRVLVKKAMSDPQIGLLGCKIYYHDTPEKIWFAGEIRDCNTGFRRYFGKNKIDDGKYEDTIECNNITGCAMFIPTKVILEVGGFDPDYFLYSEDIDLCIRIIEKGYKIFCLRKAKLWHKESSALGVHSPIIKYFSARNRLLTIYKYSLERYRFLYIIFQYNYLLGVALIKYILRGKVKLGTAYLQGIYDFHKKRFGKGRFEHLL